LVKFDVLKAEPVTSSQQGVDGRVVGELIGIFAPPGVGSAAAQAIVSSAKTVNTAGIWLVGVRYKIIDACSCEQIGTGYFEDKMQIGSKGSSFLGVTQTQQSEMTLNTMVQRLMQVAVADIDQRWKSWAPPAPSAPAKQHKRKKQESAGA